MMRKPQKVYLALAVGRMEGAGVVDQPIRVKEGCCITREVGEGGKESLTRWEALATDGTVTLLRVVIETGRTHQIRVHMAWLGHPLVGDTMYGDPEGDGLGLERHGLHCAHMALVHPLTGEELAFDSPLPPDMEGILREHGCVTPADRWFPVPLGTRGEAACRNRRIADEDAGSRRGW